MPTIDFMDNEEPRVVADIRSVLGETDERFSLVVFTRLEGMHVLTNAEMTLEDLEAARLQIEGLAEHFDVILEEARKNVSE